MATEATRRLRELTASLGRPTIGALFPDEFEVYMLTLELVDSQGEIADILSFPVMPDNIMKTENELTNIKKTMRGVVSLTTDSFVPEDISINGNFGRSFKILLGRELINFRAFGASLKAYKLGQPNIVKSPFDLKLKTGFGCTKILQKIVATASMVDEFGKPYKLFLHNPTLGESHLVEKTTLTLKQDKNTNNMMWGFSLSLKTLAPAGLIGDIGQSSFIKTLGIGALQKGLNILSSGIGEVVRGAATDPLVSVPGLYVDSMKRFGNNVSNLINGK